MKNRPAAIALSAVMLVGLTACGGTTVHHHTVVPKPKATITLHYHPTPKVTKTVKAKCKKRRLLRCVKY